LGAISSMKYNLKKKGEEWIELPEIKGNEFEFKTVVKTTDNKENQYKIQKDIIKLREYFIYKKDENNDVLIGNIKQGIISKDWTIEFNNKNFIYKWIPFGFEIIEKSKDNEGKEVDNKVGVISSITKHKYDACYNNKITDLDVIVKLVAPILYFTSKKN
jgi:hypothetical protein